MMPPSTTFAAEAKDSALLNRHSSSLHRRVHPSHCFFISSHFPRDHCPHVDTPGAEKERRACEKRIRPTPARRCGWMDGAVGGQAARRDASPHHATARGGRRWKASPDGRTVCVRKEPTRIRFTRRAARRTEAIKPPPEKEAVFRSYATMRKARATNRQNSPPSEGHAPLRLPAARNLPFMACNR